MRRSIQKTTRQIHNDPILHPKERFFFLLEIPRLEDWPSRLSLPSRYFALFLACDAKGTSDLLIRRMGRKAVRQGMRAASTWGPDCERVHDRLDDAGTALVSQSTSESVIMTTWHSSESLSKALWFFLHSAFVTGRYSRGCTTWLAVVVGNSGMASKASRYMQSQGCELHLL